LALPTVQYRSPLLSPILFSQQYPSSTTNNSQAPSQSLHHLLIHNNSVLFSPQPELVLHTENQPLFLNLPHTTVLQHIHPISHSSSENCCSPETSYHCSPNFYSLENHCSSLHTKAFLKITLPSTKDIPILTEKHDWDHGTPQFGH
jgi:hypothetical protein